jgi:hypothetical protein
VAAGRLRRDRLYQAVSHDGRISKSDFVEHVTTMCMASPQTRAAYTSLLRQRQLGHLPIFSLLFGRFQYVFVPSLDC